MSSSPSVGGPTIWKLHQGSKQAFLLYVALRCHGIRVPLLAMVAIGMILAVRVLLIAQFAAAGVVSPW